MSRGYTEMECSQMIKLYERSPTLETVQELAVKLRKPRMSIISKLVGLGIYKKKVYRNKQGELPLKKKDLVLEAERLMFLAPGTLEGADMLKKDLLKLIVQAIEDNFREKEDLIISLDTLETRLEVLTEKLQSEAY